MGAASGEPEQGGFLFHSVQMQFDFSFTSEQWERRSLAFPRGILFEFALIYAFSCIPHSENSKKPPDFFPFLIFVLDLHWANFDFCESFQRPQYLSTPDLFG